VYFVGQPYQPTVLDLPDTTYSLSGNSSLPTGVVFDGAAKTLAVTPTDSNVGKFSFTVERTGSVDPITFEGYILHYVLDNGKMRFGAMVGSVRDPSVSSVQNAVDLWGNLTHPHYFSVPSNRYIQLTYSWPNIPINMALGLKTTSPTSGMWNRNQVFELMNGFSGTTRIAGESQIDLSNFTYSLAPSSFVSRLNQPEVIQGVMGTGQIVATTVYELTSGQITYKVRVVNRYTLDVGKSFVRVDTSITNISSGGRALEELNIWVGTRDDWVGNTDGPVKVKGNLLPTGFQEISLQTDRADSILIESGDEGILFHSPTPGTNTISDSCCSFSNSYKKAPTTSVIRTSPQDGSYAAYIPLSESLATSSTRSITWFYAAGSSADLGGVATAVAEQSAEVVAEQEAERLCSKERKPFLIFLAVARCEAGETPINWQMAKDHRP
jgi:hypothetical protein